MYGKVLPHNTLENIIAHHEAFLEPFRSCRTNFTNSLVMQSNDEIRLVKYIGFP